MRRHEAQGHDYNVLQLAFESNESDIRVLTSSHDTETHSFSFGKHVIIAINWKHFILFYESFKHENVLLIRRRELD